MVKTNKKQAKNKKTSKRRGGSRRVRVKSSRKMMGGAIFNETIRFSDIPATDYYKINNYNDDTSRAPYLQDSRLMTGGGGGCGCSNRNRYGGRSKKTFRKKNRRLQKGGVSLTSDLLLGSAPIGPVGNFGTSGGNSLNYSMLNSGTAAVPGAIIAYDINMPPANHPAMV